ncbi:hypothetical protein MLGJGCBP_03113 [Rhodococcus sp. T7]|nr:hypothetical protein MLGJGCBP_03113 [Rhodococcus sp. T7]
MATRTPRIGGRPTGPRRPAVRILGADPGRRPARPPTADRPPPASPAVPARGDVPFRHRPRPTPPTGGAVTPPRVHDVHGDPRRAGGITGTVERQRGHRRRNPDRRSRPPGPRRPRRDVRRHPGAPHARRRSPVVRRTPRPGTGRRSRRVHPRRAPVRASRGDARPGSFDGAFTAVPGSARVPEQRLPHPRAARHDRRRHGRRTRCGEVRPAAHSGREIRFRRRTRRHLRCLHLRHRPVRPSDDRGFREASHPHTRRRHPRPPSRDRGHRHHRRHRTSHGADGVECGRCGRRDDPRRPVHPDRAALPERRRGHGREHHPELHRIECTRQSAGTPFDFAGGRPGITGRRRAAQVHRPDRHHRRDHRDRCGIPPARHRQPPRPTRIHARGRGAGVCGHHQRAGLDNARLRRSPGAAGLRRGRGPHDRYRTRPGLRYGTDRAATAGRRCIRDLYLGIHRSTERSGGLTSERDDIVCEHPAELRVRRTRRVDHVPFPRIRLRGLGTVGCIALRRPGRGGRSLHRPDSGNVPRTAAPRTRERVEPDPHRVLPARPGRPAGPGL